MTFNKLIITLFLMGLITACNDDSSSSPASVPIEPPIYPPIVHSPKVTAYGAYFRDQDGREGMLSGTVTFAVALTSAELENVTNNNHTLWFYWLDEQGNYLDSYPNTPWLKAKPNEHGLIDIPLGVSIPASITSFMMVWHNGNELTDEGLLISFHDFLGNTLLSGPGGNYFDDWSWYYGVAPTGEGAVVFDRQREQISIQRSEQDGNLCVFDNGLVSVTDMGYTKDAFWEARTESTVFNIADDHQYPPYSFSCDENPINTHRYIDDEDGVWMYSTLNDAMFYGTVVYDTFVKFLGEPPLKEKLRIRVHYGSLSSQVGYWDGAYANFSDAIPLQTSTASLDSIAHEIGHGVLNRLMGLTYLQPNMSADIRSLHEAFGDISGVVALHELAESEQITNYWLHGEENHGSKRQTNEIITEYGAIPSVLDYNAANPNFYLRIGMITYPFYVLSQKWGIDEAYRVFIAAARNCWAAPQNFTQIATCIKQQASLTTKITNDSVTYNTLKKQRAADVISAFKQVKIKLFDAGVLSHFYAPEVTELSNGFSVQFTDDSRTTGEITQWLWDFGDGQTSTQKNPTHLYLNANKYEVKLTVTNQAYATDSILLGEGGVSNHTDDFTRQINVTKVAN